jgi:WD40 repeat protein
MHPLSFSQRRVFWLFGSWCLVALTAAGPGSGGQPDKKMPPPAANEQKKAETLIRSLYKEDYRKAETDRAARSALARTLLKEGKDTPEAALRFVALREARDLAARAGDLGTSFEAVDGLGQDFAIDVLEMKADAVLTASREPAVQKAPLPLLQTALRLVTQALDADHLASAQNLLKAIEPLVRKEKLPALARQVEVERERLRLLLKHQEQLRPALERLKVKPDDAEANLVVGKYRCLIKGHWSAGLPLLARGSDATLKALAEQELARPADPRGQLTLGDGWWDLLAREPGPAREQLLRRAYYWYHQSLPRLDAATRDRVQKRIDQAIEEVPFLVVGPIRRFAGHSSAVSGSAFTPDSKRLITASADRSLRVWEVRSGKELGRLKGHTDDVTSVAVSGDGKLALSGAEDRTVRLWDLDAGKELERFQGHGSGVRAVALSPDGRLAASGGDDQLIILWDLNQRKELHRWREHKGPVEGLAFSADGTRLACASWDMTVSVWDVATRKELARLTGHGEGVYRVAFTPDGQQVVSCSADRTIRIWDVSSGKPVRQLDGHTGQVIALVMSPDGRRVLSGGGAGDNTVRLWDAASGKEVQRFEGHKEGVWSVALSPDGRWAVSTGKDGLVQLWGMPR